MKAWINGKFIDWEKATVPILSHSFSRGSAIFEVLDIIPAIGGTALFGLPEHLERFYHSAELVYMKLPCTREELAGAIKLTVLESGVRSGFCKFYAYYSAPELTIMPGDDTVDIAVFCADFASLDLDPEKLSAPVRAAVSPYRKLDPASVPVHAKSAANYMNAFLAKMEATRRGFDDVILLDAQGYVAEGATSNIFFVKDGTVMTPTLRNILPGITRKAVIEAARGLGIAVEERDIPRGDIGTFTEAFYTGSLSTVEPVISIEEIRFEAPCPGPVTTAIRDEMIALRSGALPQHAHWLTYI